MTGRVLVTGAAGFLGSHIAERFLKEGYTVVGVDNLATGDPLNLEDLSRYPEFSAQDVDISEPFEMEGPFDGVLHFACPASPVDYMELSIETLKVGSAGTLHALEIAREHGARFLLSSTSEVYGDPEVHPQPEDYWGNVNPIGPRSVYDEAKRFSESLTTAFRGRYGLETRIVRIFNTYGPRMRPGDGRVIPNFMVEALRGRPLTLYGDGSQTRSFCYVDDEIEGIYRLFHSDYEDPVNIGNPSEYTILELAEEVLRATESDSEIAYHPLPTDDPKVRCPDIARAQEVLDWAPTTPLREGLAKTAEYFRTRLLTWGGEARILG